MKSHTEEHCCNCEGGQCGDKQKVLWWREAISFSMLAVGLVVDHFFEFEFFDRLPRVLWYLAAYLIVGLPVIMNGIRTIRSGGGFFTEYTLMVIATIGAFAIGEYGEGVAVMLFYSVGEMFQSSAVGKAQRSIRALVAMTPQSAEVLRAGEFITLDPMQVIVGETIRVKPGGRVPLDGVLLGASCRFDTSALTGESLPRSIDTHGQVLAGMVNADHVVEIRVSKPFADSSLARIMHMVNEAADRKARPELIIRRFARVYTPAVFAMAVALTFLPALFTTNYVFTDWLYRALVFLVVSCPCALVISIPLSYFGGIGAAARRGILFKGSNFLDVMARVDTVVVDKTGTITEGVFAVRDVVTTPDVDKQRMLQLMAALERTSTHPLAGAVIAHAAGYPKLDATSVQEIPGRGLHGQVEGSDVLAGNTALMNLREINYDRSIDNLTSSVIVCAVGGRYAGYVTIADALKPDAIDAVKQIRKAGVAGIVMLSGDNNAVVQDVALQVGIDRAYGGLLPQDKLSRVEAIRKEQQGRVVAFVGDGINDAPVLAASDVGIAMGAMGSDVAIETADVVIQTDQPSRVATAIEISRSTRRIVIQNIILALSVKAIVMIAGAYGVASMWAAVFADVGVALLAILNSVRLIFRKNLNG